jgi:RimJ/RimL family protein N-acetyltransferase
MNHQEVINDSRLLRLNGHIQASFELVETKLGHAEQYSHLIWQHQPIFWSNISAGVCLLTRRCANDSNFIRQLWDNQEFIYSFHRQSSALPLSDKALKDILQNEYAALLDESHALHWIIRSSDGHPWGLLSLTDISRPSKKAEVLLGVLPNAPLGLATAAILVLFQFFFKAMKFNKLYSLVYKDNLRSLKSTLHLGFKIEGDLRQEIIDPKTGNFVDLIRTAC